ncbi:MAG TPA: TolC family protein [Steroidobacteraceae bacterium]|nr:TolC family protein [Steroidobacteraceae bacterium]
MISIRPLQRAGITPAMLVAAFALSQPTCAAEDPPSSAAAVPPSAALTLEEAIDQALMQAPQVVASAAALEARQAVAPSAGRLPDPELMAAVENLPINTADRFSLTRDFMTMRRIGLMQSFPSHKKRRLQSERATEEIAVAQAQLRKTRFDIARAAADTWIAAAVAEESRAQLRQLRPETELHATATRAALASGRASAAEALAAQSVVARLDERIAALDQEVETRQAELAGWVGDAADRPLASIPTERELGHSPDALLAAVPEHAPLAPFIAQLDAAKTDVELARAEKRPDWSAELSYQERSSDFSDMVSLEFRVGLPIFAGQRQNPVIAEKLAMVRAQEAERDAEIRMHTSEVRAVLAEWRGGRERLKRYAAELLPLARDRSHAAVSSYGAGRGDLRAAIEALSDEIDTRLEYVELEGSVTRAWIFLHFLHDSRTSP